MERRLEDTYEYGDVIGSCDGLLAFGVRDKSLVLNPVTKERREILSPATSGFGGYVCAIYFDRFLDDYKLLHVFPTRSGVIEYHTFSFTQNEWSRITPTSTSNSTGRLDDSPPRFTPPAIVADALHWVARFSYRFTYKILVVFKIQAQTIHFLHVPASLIPVGQNDGTHLGFMQLIETTGKLCLCHIKDGIDMDMWILEEYGNQESWVQKFKVYVCGIIGIGLNLVTINVVPMKGEYVLLNMDNKTVYAFDLGTHEKRLILSMSDWNQKSFRRYHVVALTKTLLSPNNMYSKASSLNPLFEAEELDLYLLLPKRLLIF